MNFILNADTAIKNPYNDKPVINGVNILKRDIKKVCGTNGSVHNEIILEKKDFGKAEYFEIGVSEAKVIINAGDDLGFIYALLYISEKYLDIKPFWFWMDQKIVQKNEIEIPAGCYSSRPFDVKFRGWFFNDEVLFMKWNADGSNENTWRMAFEALLRCGGNITIPGTDKMSRQNRALAAEMGLWLTHHHAEPLGAEMFARAYPDKSPLFAENADLFYKLWEDAAIEQKDYNVIWNLCFRGQGDCPFWSSDPSYNTPEKQGALISEVIKKQCDIVKKYVENPIFCTNLYGEIMELYKDGYITLDSDIIKVRADNGYGKMVTRRRGEHSPRVLSMPEKNMGSQGIYYHVSFYDLQAANHITAFPNSVDFINDELNNVSENDGNDFWIINCSNVRPHVYALDAVRKKWRGENISDHSHSIEFAENYYSGNPDIAAALEEYPNAVLSYGNETDEHAGEQFYTENVRIMAHQMMIDVNSPSPQLKWIAGSGSFAGQIGKIRRICENGIEKLSTYLKKCERTAESLSGDEKMLFSSLILLHAQIHALCCSGMITFINSIESFIGGDYKKAFILAGDAAELFDRAENAMRSAEYGVWKDFYYNDCLADIKHSAYMIRKAMGRIREYGDSISHDKWYRETIYSREDRNIYLLMVTDNHMADWDLYKAMKNKGGCL